MGIEKVRYHLLDEARGFAVLCMVFYHAFYTMAWMFDISIGLTLLNFFEPAEPFFAAFFIFLSGIACQLTHSNLKRGLKLLVVSLFLTGITLILPYFNIEGAEIYFGILHLLSFGMLLVALMNKVIKSTPILLGAIVFFVLFLVFYNIESGYLGFGKLRYTLPQSLYTNDNLFILGFHSDNFYSADYFPILPWIFMFLCGAFIGLYAPAGKFPSFLCKKCIPPFAFIGRHALLIYIVHQPLIYAVIYLVYFIINLF